MIFNFFSTSVNIEKRPLCPQCNKIKLAKRMSVFATSRNRSAEDDMPRPDLDESKLEQAMQLLSKEVEHVNEDDPRQAANLMRKLTEMTGLNLGHGMEEALKRMEAGEDPDQIEAEMGDLLEGENPFEFKEKSVRIPKSQIPPGVDEKLYDL
jgi:hypothetical protein